MLLRQVRRLAAGDSACPETDRQLLDDFTARRDEVAFTALVARHGSMVLRVCRRVLSHEQDAEDAFQATFLVMARNTASIRKRDTVGDWLHGVAYRTAMKAKRSAARRRNHETRRRAAVPPPAPGPSWDDVQAILDEAIQKLPPAFRQAFILSVLEGKSASEVAAELGCKEGTVRSRVSRARRLLQQWLTRRGIKLTVVLAALSLTESAGRAALPRALAQAAVRSGLLVAAGESAGGVIPARVAALAAGVARGMFLTKTKIALAALLAVSLFAAGAGVLAHHALAAREAEPPRPAESPRRARVAELQPPKQAARPSQDVGEDDPDAVSYRGRVLDPDGKPVAGAKVYYHFITREDEPIPVRTATDSQGRFSFTLTRKDVPLSADAIQADPRKIGQVIVKADGFTFAWRTATGKAEELNLQLGQDEAPMEGRMVDLQGKPLAGLRVSTLSVFAPEKGDLSAFVKALESGESLYQAVWPHVPNYLRNPIIGRSLAGFLPVTTTDADGRFRLRGFARERLVELRVEGPAIETQDLFVVTRARPAGSARMLNPARIKDLPIFGPDPRVLVFWNGFDHAIAPGQTVVGTVRDRTTGRAIPRAIVESYALAGTRLSQNTSYSTAADDQGRYRFTGLPRGKGNRIRIRPPRDQAYIPIVKNVPPSETFAQATVDVSLSPGVWVDVTAADKSTGKPVPGYVSYFVLPEKWDAESRFSAPYADAYDNMMAIRNDGTFRFVAVPGKAVVAFRTDWSKYPIAREAATIRLPSGLAPSNFQAFTAIHPKRGDDPVKVAFTLSAERVVKGTLIDPDGQPLAGALAAGLRHDWLTDGDWPLSTAEFTVLGLDPARPRLLCFVHPDRKLAGSVVVRGDEQNPVTVRLQPWGTVSGRLLDANGKPIKNARLAFVSVPVGKPDLPRPLDTGLHVIYRSAYEPSQDPQTDAEGRFRIERIVPGLKYNLARYDPDGAVDFAEIKWTGLAFSNLVLKPGETKDLGDARLQPFPKE
jgi:RNA polymerase sigma factor (sigma-70 family)